MNYSDRKTKESLAELEKKLQTEYRKAYQSMVSRWSEYINGKDEVVNGRVVHHKSLAERIAEEEKKHKEGLYTEKEWTAYCLAQIGRGEKFRAMSEALAERMSNTNKVAAAYVNDKTPSIYSLNANYQAYEIGKGLEGVSFTMYDEQTVKNMITENGNYTEFRTLRVDPKRDYLWNTKQIQSAVTSGILQGKGIKDLTDSFMTVMQRNRNAAIRNARTAYTSAQNGGRMASLRQAKAQGINVRKQWLSAHDNRVRDTHAVLNGQIRNIEEKFDNGLLYPADSSGAPAEVYNCRCTLTYIYPDWDTDESAEIYKSNALEGETFQEFVKRMKKNERERENEYGLKYGDASIDGDVEMLNSESFKQKFRNISSNDNVVESVYNCAKKVTIDNLGTKKESLFLIDADTGDIISSITEKSLKIDSGIAYPDYFKQELEEAIKTNKKIISIHNHPEGYPPSADDLRKAFENHYVKGYAIGANGQVYEYSNTSIELTKEICDEIYSEINALCSGGWDVDRAYNEIYKSLNLGYNVLK